MEQRFCPGCGEPLEQEVRFCGSCGRTVEAASPPSTATEPIEPAPEPVEAASGPMPAGPPSGPPPSAVGSPSVPTGPPHLDHATGPPPVVAGAGPPTGPAAAAPPPTAIMPVVTPPYAPPPSAAPGASRGLVIGLLSAAVALVAALVFVTTRGDDDESSPSTSNRRTTTVAPGSSTTRATTTTGATTTVGSTTPQTTTTAVTTSSPPDGDAAVAFQDFTTPGPEPFLPGVETEFPGPVTVGLPELEFAAPAMPDAESSLLGAWGDQLRLYAGRRDQPSCDGDALLSFVQGDLVAAAAWAVPLGIVPEDVPGYIQGLTSVVLTRDTRITSHHYEAGQAVGYQTVLRAGLPVLIDDRGMPRVDCVTGNPLTEHVPTATPPTYDGAWVGFDPEAVVAVVPAGEPLYEFVVVDLGGSRPFVRWLGLFGPDVDLDLDRLCALAPDDPSCTTPDDPGRAAITILDATLTACGYSITEYVDNGWAGDGYSVIAVTPMGEAEFIVYSADYIDVNDQTAADIAVECGFYQP